MRVLAMVGLGLAGLGWEATARADDKADADALVRDGQALGNQGDYRGALAKFKAAALKFERAVNDCNIGAAYAELGRWPQAQLFLDRCRSRTSNADQRAFAEQRLAQVMTELGAGKFAAVEVVVEPAGAAFTVSSFAPDEKVLPPRVVWLAHGQHDLVIERDGFTRKTVRVEVPGPTRVSERLQPLLEIDLRPKGDRGISAAPVPRARASGRRRWGKILFYGGLGVAAAGGVFHYLASSARGRAEDLPAGDAYDDEVATLKWQRAVAVGAYGVGGLAVGTGLYLLLTGKESSRAPVTLAPSAGGATVLLGGRFE